MQTDRLKKGDVGEAKVTSRLTELGFIVSDPVSVAPYDLILDKDDELFKVQVKTTHKQEDGNREVYAVGFRKSGRFYNGNLKDEKYTSDEVDYFAIYNDIHDEIYWLSFEEAPECNTDRVLDGWREELIDRKI